MSRWGKGRGGRPWRRLRLQVFARDHYTCRVCGRVTGTPECDHIVPESMGGESVLRNLQTLCVECHAVKTTREANGGQDVRRVQQCGADGWPV